MSIKTDVASLEILAKVYQSQELKQTLHDLVHTLEDQVSYIDWAGIYLIEGNQSKLVVATDLYDQLTWEANAELKIPIENENKTELGRIVIKSRQLICFDVTDITTLQTLAREISCRMFSN